MMYDKTNEMVKAINNEINFGLHEYKHNGRSDLYNRVYSRINAMIEMLRIVTNENYYFCLLYTSPSPRDPKTSRMPSSA